MEQTFIITEIARVIYVGASEYPDSRTSFCANLKNHELIFHFSGEAILNLGGKEYLLQENTLRLMAQGDHGNYDITRIKTGDCIDIFFQTDTPVFSECLIRQMTENDKIGLLFKRIFNLWVQRDEGYYLKCMSILYDILARIQAENYLPEAKYSKIAPAVKYITDHFRTGDINCESLAEMCGISYSYLKQIFIEKYKASPKQYIVQIRMNYACNLLLSGLFSINQVAEQCGFSETSFFSRQFKKYVGSSPRDFIKKYESSK